MTYKLTTAQKLAVAELYQATGDINLVSQSTHIDPAEIQSFLEETFSKPLRQKVGRDFQKSLDEPNHDPLIANPFVVPDEAVTNVKDVVQRAKHIREMAFQRLEQRLPFENNTERLVAVLVTAHRIAEQYRALSGEGAEPTVINAFQNITNNFQGDKELLALMVERLNPTPNGTTSQHPTDGDLPREASPQRFNGNPVEPPPGTGDPSPGASPSCGF